MLLRESHFSYVVSSNAKPSHYSSTILVEGDVELSNLVAKIASGSTSYGLLSKALGGNSPETKGIGPW